MKEVTHEYSDKENNGNFDVELIIWHLAIPLSNKQQREIIKWTFSLVEEIRTHFEKGTN